MSADLKTKPKTLAIDPQLHRYIDLLRARLGKSFKDIVEPTLWAVVKENREAIEQAGGEPVALPSELEAAA